MDTIGELGWLYGLAQVAFVGGSLVPHGGHNPIEPALWDIPVLTGPHTHNFADVTEQLRQAGSLFQSEAEPLLEKLTHWLESPESATSAAKAAEKVLKGNRGALTRQLEAIENLLAS